MRCVNCTRARQPADIEFIVQWALSRSGNLPWSQDRDKELAFDKGLTAKPRKRPPVNWTIAEACAGMRLSLPKPLPARMTPCDDTTTIIEAIKSLDPKTAELVIACGRSKIRPLWTVNGKAEPELVTLEGVYGKTKKGKHWKRIKRPRTIQVWEPSEEAICSARAAYTRWHGGLVTLSWMLDGALSRFCINGLAAPAVPWETLARKTA